jgi:hypothetical protein
MVWETDGKKSSQHAMSDSHPIPTAAAKKVATKK